MNIMNMNQQLIDSKDKKFLQYPLLKSVSWSNINNYLFPFNNNKTNISEENNTWKCFGGWTEEFMNIKENKINYKLDGIKCWL